MNDEKVTVYKVNQELCIGCHRCFRVCTYQAVTGTPKEKHSIDPAKCMGCGACLDCPKGAISETTVDVSVRTLETEWLVCECCGAATITKQQAAWGAARKGVNADAFVLCDECKRKAMVGKVKSLMGC